MNTLISTLISIAFFSLSLASQNSPDFDKAVAEFTSYENNFGHYFQTSNVKMHYLRWGNTEDRTLIWIHGTRSDAYELRNLIDTIVNSGIQVIAIDYYAHGQTKMGDKEISLYHIADDINELMIHLKIDKAIIGGWSRGGSIASAFYDEYPDKTEAIVLLAGGAVNWLVPIHKRSWNEYDSLNKKNFAKYPPQKFFNTKEEAYNYYYNPERGGSQFHLLNSINKSNKNDRYGYFPHLFEYLSSDTYENKIESTKKPTKGTLYQYSTAILEPKIIYRNLNIPLLLIDSNVQNNWTNDFRTENKIFANEHEDFVTYIHFENLYHAIHWLKPKEFVSELLDFINQIGDN